MFTYSYLILIVVTLVIGIGATAYVKSQIKKYSKVPISTGLTGAEAAHQMLSYYGVTDVEILRGSEGQNFFDPRSKSITLDPDAHGGRSITATATACHEVGHACQYSEGYVPIKIRGALVPVVSFTSNAWMFILLIGIFLNIAGLVDLAIIFYAFAVLFQVVTLPVEFNASRRAMTYLETVGLPQGEQGNAYSVLRACALTYVAAALVSVLQLLWLLSQRN